MTNSRSFSFVWGAMGLGASLVVACATPARERCASSADCAPDERCIDSACRVVPGTDGGSLPDVPVEPLPDAGPLPDVAASDSGCGGEAIAFDHRPPNVLVIFDRSCSMRRTLDALRLGTGPEDPSTRWYVAREAVEGLIGRFSSQVFWGLMAFPDSGEGCGLPIDVDVAPAPGTAMAIHRLLREPSIVPFGLCGPGGIQPGVTPTQEALRSALETPELSDPVRESFAILVTDGAASCDATIPDLAALATSLRDRGVLLAVVGFGTGGRASSLEAIAAAGGLPNPEGPESYYTADTGDDLTRIFDDITTRVVSCELRLTSRPADPTLLFVNANDAPLASDPRDGWTYDEGMNVLLLNGESCMNLQRGTITRLSISFGCPPAACVPQPEICNGLDEDCDGVVDDDCLF